MILICAGKHIVFSLLWARPATFPEQIQKKVEV